MVVAESEAASRAPTTSSLWLWTAAASVAVALALHTGPASSLVAWLHGLLACSSRYPPPPDVASDVAVVLGYALHRYVFSRACSYFLKACLVINAGNCSCQSLNHCTPIRNGTCTRPLQSRVEVGVALFQEVRSLS